MKKLIFLLFFIFALSTVNGQVRRRLTYTTTLGTAIPINEPSYIPLLWQIMSHYHFTDRLSVGAGTGLSFYEKLLCPVFADIRFHLTRPKRAVPYLECDAGYGFAFNKDANGGFYLHPSVGIQYALYRQIKLSFSLGFEMQNLERLKKHESGYYSAEFAEKLRHRSLSVRLGIMF